MNRKPTKSTRVSKTKPTTLGHRTKALIKRRHLPFTAVILIIVITLQVMFNIIVINQQMRGDTEIINQLIFQAVDNLTQTAAVDAPTGKVYVSSQHLMFPALPDQFRSLRYSTTTPDGEKTEMDFTTGQAINMARNKMLIARGKPASWFSRGAALNNLFAEVPNLQVCSRGIHTFTEPNSSSAQDFHSEGSKKLKDGRTLYFYTETTKCSTDLTPLVDYLKQVESY